MGYFRFGEGDFGATPISDEEFAERKKEVYAKSNLVTEAQGAGLGEITNGPSTLSFEVSLPFPTLNLNFFYHSSIFNSISLSFF